PRVIRGQRIVDVAPAVDVPLQVTAAVLEAGRRIAERGQVAPKASLARDRAHDLRSEEHTSELQSRENLVCRLLLEKKNIKKDINKNETRKTKDIRKMT